MAFKVQAWLGRGSVGLLALMLACSGGGSEGGASGDGDSGGDGDGDTGDGDGDVPGDGDGDVPGDGDGDVPGDGDGDVPGDGDGGTGGLGGGNGTGGTGGTGGGTGGTTGDSGGMDGTGGDNSPWAVSILAPASHGSRTGIPRMDDSGIVHALFTGFDGTNALGLYYATLDEAWEIDPILPDERWQVHDFALVDGAPHGLVQRLNSELLTDYVFFLYHDGSEWLFEETPCESSTVGLLLGHPDEPKFACEYNDPQNYITQTRIYARQNGVWVQDPETTYGVFGAAGFSSGKNVLVTTSGVGIETDGDWTFFTQPAGGKLLVHEDGTIYLHSTTNETLTSTTDGLFWSTIDAERGQLVVDESGGLAILANSAVSSGGVHISTHKFTRIQDGWDEVTWSVDHDPAPDSFTELPFAIFPNGDVALFGLSPGGYNYFGLELTRVTPTGSTAFPLAPRALLPEFNDPIRWITVGPSDRLFVGYLVEGSLQNRAMWAIEQADGSFLEMDAATNCWLLDSSPSGTVFSATYAEGEVQLVSVDGTGATTPIGPVLAGDTVACPREIVRSDDGAYHIAYLSAGDLYYGRLSEGAWETQLVNDDYTNSETRLVVDGDDVAWLLYEANYNMAVSRWAQAGWQHTGITFNQHGGYFFVVDPAGRPCIENVEFSRGAQHCFTGSGWDTADMLSGFSTLTGAGIDSNGNIHQLGRDIDDSLIYSVTDSTETVEHRFEFRTHSAFALTSTGEPRIVYHDEWERRLYVIRPN